MIRRRTAKPTRRLPAALALATLLLALPAAAQAGSGGLGPEGPSKGGEGGASTGTIEGLSPTYAKFSQIVAANTKLSLRVVGAWTLAEGGPKDNPLNIGPGHRYGTVRKGARATTSLLKHPLYNGVMASADEPDPVQIDAIVDSSWCPGCRGYKRLLRRTYKSVKVSP